MPSILILAGGEGVRFWPRSTRSRPKQFLPLAGGDRVMAARTWDRAVALVGEERVFLVTGERHEPLVRQFLPEVPESQILLEPEGRSTAAAVLLGCARIASLRGEGEVVAVLPSDHRIADERRFRSLLEVALTWGRSGRMLFFGVPPTRPETGFGYLRIRPLPVRGIFQGVGFVEKPSEEEARDLIRGGEVLWNTGIYVFQVRRLAELAGRIDPRLREGYEGFLRAWRDRDGEERKRVHRSLPAISLEYALLSRLSSFFVLPGDFGWDDLGDWRSLERIRPRDRDGNVSAGRAALLECRDCIVDEGSQRVALFGVRDLVVAACPEGVLVCPRDRVGELRCLVDHLKESGRADWL